MIGVDFTRNQRLENSLDRMHLAQVLEDMKQRGEVVITLSWGIKNWIERLDPARGITLHSEITRSNTPRFFTWSEMERGGTAHSRIKKALRYPAGTD